jgi:glutamate racemase (EC 5.1.1.3)
MVIQNHQDAEELPKTLQTSPTILIIDSGVGGLSVYSEVVKLLPMAHYLYVFDNDGFPYGTKEEAFIIERVNDHYATDGPTL